MAWEDTNKSYIKSLIDNKEWEYAYNCLLAYIEKYGEDYFAKNAMKLVEDSLPKK